MSSYTILFENSKNADYAYKFTKALLESGHKISKFFCYKEGINLALSATGVFAEKWRELLETQDFKISLCSASAHKQGLDKLIKNSEYLNKFEIASISSFIIDCTESDFYIQF